MMTAYLIEGMMVNVYEDPLSCARLEGRAVLLKQLEGADSAGVSRWRVSFESDNMVVDRLINPVYALLGDNGFIEVSRDQFAAMTVGLKGNDVTQQHLKHIAAMQYSITDGNGRHRLFAQAKYTSVGNPVYQVARWYIMGLAGQWYGDWHSTIIKAGDSRMAQLNALIAAAAEARSIELENIPAGVTYTDAIDVINISHVLALTLTRLGGSQ